MDRAAGIFSPNDHIATAESPAFYSTHRMVDLFSRHMTKEGAASGIGGNLGGSRVQGWRKHGHAGGWNSIEALPMSSVYRAFISYNHADAADAIWLHRALEHYRIPKGIGSGMTRLRPIFRDQDELSTSADLGTTLRDVLERSDYLIVLCSQASARSHWVNEEIDHFLRHRDLDRIICVFVEPRPDASTGTPDFPPALIRAIGGGGEPLAADLREGRDGRRLVRAKVAATLLNVPLDVLLRREARQRLRVLAATTALACGISLVMAVLAMLAIQNARRASAQQAEAEGLVAYMLGDLSDQLGPVGRLDILDGVGTRVIAHYDTIPPSRRDERALVQQSKALILLGGIRDKQGNLAGSKRAFEKAMATTRELVRRRPDDGQRVFDHAQAVYWTAYGDWRLGAMAEAQAGFELYRQLSERLVRLDPANSEWALESAYANSNLGTLLYERGQIAQSLKAFQKARDIFAQAFAQSPAERDRAIDLADADGWVADSLVRLGQLKAAHDQRSSAATLLQAQAVIHPEDKALLARSLAAQLALARRELDMGKVETALARVRAARAGLVALSAFDPSNTTWIEYLALAEMDLSDLAYWLDDPEGARAANVRARTHMRALTALSPNVQRWKNGLDWRVRLQALRVSGGNNAPQFDRAASALALEIAAASRDPSNPDERDTSLAAVRASQEDWSAVADLIRPIEMTVTPDSRDLLARALSRTGQEEHASAIVRRLRVSGYAHPGFEAYWNRPDPGSQRQAESS